MSSPPSDLANRRAEIDKFDREIHRLLTERAKVVYGVMRAKAAATAAGEVTPPFRPGREAEVLRALVSRHTSEFPVSSLLQIWREIVSGATRMQAVQQIAVLAGDPVLGTLARDHFGVGAEYLNVPTTAGAMAMLSGMEVAAAVVPMAIAGESGQWWYGLIDDETPEGAPKVVARLPFFQAGADGQAVVLSPFPTDPSSDDRGIVGLALSTGATLDAAINCLSGSGLAPVAPPLQAGQHVWLEVGRLLSPGDPVLGALNTLPGIERAMILGGYAVPLA
jgi:chorismate mutase / prephenate dehydratase